MEDQPENNQNYSSSREDEDFKELRNESKYSKSPENTPNLESLEQRESKQSYDNARNDAPSNYNERDRQQYKENYQERSNFEERPRQKYRTGKPNDDVIRKAQEFIIFVYMAIASLLGFRFILSLLGANQQSPFVSFIYDVTYPPLLPFDGMFGRDLYRPTGFTLEFEILVALLVYAVVFYGFNRLIAIIFD